MLGPQREEDMLSFVIPLPWVWDRPPQHHCSAEVQGYTREVPGDIEIQISDTEPTLGREAWLQVFVRVPGDCVDHFRGFCCWRRRPWGRHGYSDTFVLCMMGRHVLSLQLLVQQEFHACHASKDSPFWMRWASICHLMRPRSPHAGLLS